MAEGPSNHHHHLIIQPPQQQQRTRTQLNSRLGPRSGGAGEIIEVQGGHIVRSTGRKDRHSKVCTAKGPRDRRVRLSAHTAIQFYDVQDRLGYDRPSKAVDWLIKNAKTAIDELAQLPAWHPTATCTRNPAPLSDQPEHAVEHESSSPYADAGFGASAGSSCFLPPSLDSDAIADTIKSFFPIAAAAAAAQSTGEASSPIGYQNYPPDLLSRSSSSSQNQDLRLSLQSFPNPDPMFHHQQNEQQQQQHVLFSGFDASSTPAASMAPWAEASGGSVGGGYVYNMPLQLQLQLQQQAAAMNHHHHQMMLGQLPAGQFFTQRGTLQSSNPPFARAAWIDSPIDVAHSTGFAFGSSGFSGFRIPTRVQGEEEHDGLSDKPSSASSSSHH